MRTTHWELITPNAGHEEVSSGEAMFMATRAIQIHLMASFDSFISILHEVYESQLQGARQKGLTGL